MHSNDENKCYPTLSPGPEKILPENDYTVTFICRMEKL
jgi:hypothetical protein